jgi:hypothetical protein
MARDKTELTDKTPAATLATTAPRGANEWGIPDWRDANFYRGLTNWSTDRWQWEFLRRREDYRRDFEAAAREVGSMKPCFEHVGAEKYDLEEFFDPKISDWKAICGPMWHPLPLPSIDKDGLPILRPDWVEITFDISKSLAPQLKAAKEELEAIQSLDRLSDTEATQLAYGVEYSGKPEIPFEFIKAKSEKRLRAPKHHTDKWPVYLRVLDAREAEASWANIANMFYDDGLLDRRAAPEGGYCRPPPQAASNLWLQAQALRF